MTNLQHKLATAIGADKVSADPAALNLFGQDLFSVNTQPPAAVVTSV